MAKALTEEERKSRNAYVEKWKKENMRQIRFRLNVRTDEDILARLDAQENIQGYIKSLIRADIARNPSPASADQGEQGEQE
jgi:hypothetical protein